MPKISVLDDRGVSFHVRTGAHEVQFDGIPGNGAHGAGPQPEEMFVGAVAVSAGHAALGLLKRLGLPTRGLRIGCSYDMELGDATGIATVHLTVCLPDGVPVDREGAVISAIFNSSLYSTLRTPPTVRLTVSQYAED